MANFNGRKDVLESADFPAVTDMRLVEVNGAQYFAVLFAVDPARTFVGGDPAPRILALGDGMSVKVLGVSAGPTLEEALAAPAIVAEGEVTLPKAEEIAPVADPAAESVSNPDTAVATQGVQ